MRTLFFLVFIVIFPAVTYSQPLIVFDTDRHDFGLVPRGDKLEHTFGFANRGDEELIIEKLVPSWGCTATMASSSRLKPREKGKITARVNIKGEEGFISSVVRVLSNDPATPVVTLFLEAMIEDTTDTPSVTKK